MSVKERVQRLFGRRQLNVWHSDAYRLPFSGLPSNTPMEPRRADFVLWYLDRLHLARVSTPMPISYAKLATVHGEAYLESLQEAKALALVFGVDVSDVPAPAALLHTVRLAVGGTVAAARASLKTGEATLNLLGGFHHAGRNHGGGFCAVNDIAVALADLRHRGFSERVAVLDVDAHPPDGTAECLDRDAATWIGSLSGSDWGPLPGVDETVLPQGASDEIYLGALRALLSRMPKVAFAFVVAGGDVLAGDTYGLLGLSEAGARERDRLILEALRGIPSVWLPGGGYQAKAWRVLAGTGLVLAGRAGHRIPSKENPLRWHFSEVSREIDSESLGEPESPTTKDELDDLLNRKRPSSKLLLGYYSAEGIEYALERYGLLDQLRRLGFHHFKVDVGQTNTGERLSVSGEIDGARHMLLDSVLERKSVGGAPVLFINWLSLTDPRAHFSAQRPQLPGQEKPGLGLAREASELFARMAKRLGLAGVALDPAWYHVAYASRHDFHFLDPARQGRFEALVRDLTTIPLAEATRAVAEGRVRMNGVPYVWEPHDMVFWVTEDRAPDRAAVAAERDRVHFEIAAPSPHGA